MEIKAGMVRRGYVEADGENDTHGFRKQDRRLWVMFTGKGWQWHKRSEWIDYLGDRYVLSLEGDRFIHLANRREIWAFAPVDEEHPNVAPKMAFEVDW